MGDGNALPISHVGSSLIASQSHPLLLNNVLHVPQITKNLISVSKFTKDNNVIAEFFSDGCLIKDKTTKQVLLKGTLKRGLYQLNTNQIDRSRGSLQAQFAAVLEEDLEDQQVSFSDKTVSFDCNKVDCLDCNKVQSCFLASVPA